MSCGESHFLKQTLYNIEMGLFDHRHAELDRLNPLACIRAFKEESISQQSLFDDLVYRWRKNKIYSRLNIDLFTYSRLPIPLTKKLDEVAITIVKQIEDEEEKQKTDFVKNLSS